MPDTALPYDATIFFGDLNYRLDMDRNQVKSMEVVKIGSTDRTCVLGTTDTKRRPTTRTSIGHQPLRSVAKRSAEKAA